MTKQTPEELITTVLEHSRFYDPDKAREYYLRTRKLVGQKAKKLELGYNRTVFKALGSDYDKVVKLGKDADNLTREVNNLSAGLNKKKKDVNREERVAMQQRKIDRARGKAKKLPPEKRSSIEKKLDLLESRLKKANPFAMRFSRKSKSAPKRKLNTKNPFAGTRISRD